jgi:hypothetical protein
MSCRAQRAGETLILENNLIRRELAWNSGALSTRLVADKRNSRRWDMAADTPDLVLPGEDAPPTDARLAIEERPATPISPAHLAVEVLARVGALEVKRVFRLYEDCPAIACDVYLRGRAASSSWLRAGDIEELVSGKKLLPGPGLERFAFGRAHLQAECVAFYDVTDWRNTLTESRRFLSYRSPVCARGNLLLAHDTLSHAGFFILKEAPCSDMQLSDPGCDFIVGRGQALVVGLGVEPRDLDEGEWTRCAGVVTGVASGGADGLLSALRVYQHARRAARQGRDDMIMLNTWGDRGGEERISEAFVLAELEAGARLGVTHFQIDDGWQAGVFTGGNPPGQRHVGDYWSVHPGRFPRGLAPVATQARKLGIELCLWFAPESADRYAGWHDNADRLVRLWQDFGIRTFKIDGVQVADAAAVRNLTALFDTVLSSTNGQAFFNLDVTAGRRFGYHCLTEYGNLFVENRYTDWSNYYPHWTLRNLWQLARYLPPQILQIEFLNPWRNQDKYPEDDPLAPANVPFDYGFAVTLMAQPLAWFEASGLPEEAFAVAPIVQAYRRHQPRLHEGRIFPIGEEPSGTAWTGFQSIRPDGGYVMVYREHNERQQARLRLRDAGARQLDCRLVLGSGADGILDVDSDGSAEFRLPEPFSYALYEYRAVR